jgi:hypothetical protein
MKLIVTFLAFNIFLTFGQNEDVVEVFTISEFNKNVLLSWTISEGSTCNGIDVFRSIDGVNYIKIGDIEGICGSNTESIDYNFTDMFPEKNTFNYYRLGLGGLGYTYSVKINIIDIAVNSYQVRPQPINVDALLLFNNDSVKEAELKIYNAQGELVLQKVTNKSKFELRELSSSPSGLYLFTLKLNDKEIKGKIEVP